MLDFRFIIGYVQNVVNVVKVAMSKEARKKLHAERRKTAAFRRARLTAILSDAPVFLSTRKAKRYVRDEMQRRFGFEYPNAVRLDKDMAWYQKQQTPPDKERLATAAVDKLLQMIDGSHMEQNFNAAIQGLRLLSDWGWIGRQTGDHEHFTSELERILGTED